MNTNDFDAVIGTFIAESQEFLQEMENQILAIEKLEKNEEILEAVNKLFRAAHSIKGGASMFSLKELSHGAHALEDSFAILRDRAELSELSTETISLLLQGIDRLKQLMQKSIEKEEILPEEIELIESIKTQLETWYKEDTPQEKNPAENLINPDVIKIIFANDLPPLLEKLETELSQAKEEELGDTLAQLNSLYYQFSGLAGMLELEAFGRVTEGLMTLITQPNLSLEELKKEGWSIAQQLRSIQEAIVQEKPIPTEQILTKQIPTEEIPTEKIPTEEIPTEEIYTEQTQEKDEEKTAPPKPLKEKSFKMRKKEEIATPSTWQRPTIRVDLEHLSELVNLVGELVINRTHLEVKEAELKAEAKRIRRSVFELNQFGTELRDEYDRLASGPYSIVPEKPNQNGEFDSLEMDSYSEFHSTAQSAIMITQTIAQSGSKINELANQLDNTTDHLRRITNQLRSKVIQLRVVPFSRCVDHLPRALRELCQSYNKEVNLLLLGRETKIDESLVDALRDPLVHLLRNAFDHGIESPEEREEAGKPSIGQIEIEARHQGGQTIITITDDGSGIDPESIRKQAIKKEFVTPEQAKSLSVAELYELLFWSGFSTKQEATHLSGRGVGLDVVRTNLRKVRGNVKVDSRPGKGTSFILKLPLMLSITNALLVRVDHNTVAVPLDAVEEIIHLEGEQVQMAGTQPMLAWREEYIRLTRLQDLLHYSIPHPDGPSPDPLKQDYIPVLVVSSAEGFLAIAVERLVGQQEIVVKTLPAPLSKPKGIIGNTILGNGQVVTILDVDDLIAQFNPQSSQGVAVSDRSNLLENIPLSSQKSPQILVVDDSYTIRQLLSLTLKRGRYRVESAKDGLEALEKLEKGLECALAIVDIEMPRMDGFEFVKTVKSHTSFAHIPIAMLTSRSGVKHRQKAMELGAIQYFTKPYNENQLLEAIEQILSS